jgi:hypothetical protein
MEMLAAPQRLGPTDPGKKEEEGPRGIPDAFPRALHIWS